MDIRQVKEKIESHNLTTVIVWLLVIVGIILRLKCYFFNQSFWLDECSLGVNINSAKNYSDFFKPLVLWQCAPPFFMIVCKALLDISHQAGHIHCQDLILRLFPCLCSILSLPLFVLFVQKVTNNRYFLWTSVAMLSFNKCAINYSQQFKQYSCEMMFALILLLSFYSIKDIRKISVRKLSFFVLIFILSMWFSNSAILILFVGYSLLFFRIIREKYANKTKLAILLIPMFLNLIIYYFLYFRRVYNALYDYMFEYWKFSIPSFFTFSDFFPLFTAKMQGIIEFSCQPLLIIFLLANLFIFFIKQEFDKSAKFLIILPIILCIISSFLCVYPFEARLVLFLLPLFVMIYSQISLMIKPSKFATMLLLVSFVIIAAKNLSIPAQTLVNEANEVRNFRKYSQFVVDKKISYDKLIMGTTDQAYYYLSDYFKGNRPLLEENIFENFENSEFPKFEKTMPLGEYWLIFPEYADNTDFNLSIKKYIITNPNLKILKIWEDEKNKKSFIIKFEKVN